MKDYDLSTQDEGYSEDPLTVGSSSGSAVIPQYVEAMPVAQRTEYVMSIINHLPTSEVCEIVRRLRPRLYIDFFQYLPPEVCLKVLGFLDPVSLINTARASREWMLLALDRKLWERLYILEGFRVVRSEVAEFEEELNSERVQTTTGSESSLKRRTTPQRSLPTVHADADSDMMDVDTPLARQESLFGPSKLAKLDLDEKMIDLLELPTILPSKPAQSSRHGKMPAHDGYGRRLSAASVLPKNTSSVSNMSSLVVVDRGDNKKKLNWQYLYSQRRRLEANWENEKYTNFQLPHPKHPQEAHQECIYTIQHSGKYLVSGSRDRSLRIWDLDTRRLVRSPLNGHHGSVLCLQFDADPEEDLIVSGSSDATIILWRFSTGQIIQRLRKAHRESVLNVRFDKRVLVTCSKDKTIKVFNRKPIGSEDKSADSRFMVNPVGMSMSNFGYNPSPSAGVAYKPAYSQIASLEGHGAAVNAVQILGDEVVSASGDRTVKVWTWPDQYCHRTLLGHQKGIACVQYDGRRIVSGSSDNEVKVFDKESGLEIASLRAHSNLVRTVQAGFGDLPYSAEQDIEDAKNVDHDYFKAIDAGEIDRDVALQRGRPRNAGSRKPEDITAYGAKLPPGGGGGKFGRIVSGSYDETVIIWRRDKEGVWRAQHTLRQEEAAAAAARTEPITHRRSTPATAQTAPANQSQIASAQTNSNATAPTNNPTAPTPNAPTIPFAPGSHLFYNHLIENTVPLGPAALRQALQAHPQMLLYPRLRQAIGAITNLATRQLMTAEVTAAAQSQQPTVAGVQTTTANNVTGQSSQNSNTSTQSQASASSAVAASAPSQATHGPQVQPTVQTAPQPAQPPAGNAGPVAPPNAAQQAQANMARVFKLQFDARRIICCSQTSVIVGWDFANGDEQLIEASRFFAPIE